MTKPTALLAGMKEKKKKKDEQTYRVRVGMATCGISAGADRIFEEFKKAVKEAKLDNVEVIPTGCVGRCDLEPMAEVTRGSEPPVLYIKLDPDKVRRIVQEHLVSGKPVMEYAE